MASHFLVAAGLQHSLQNTLQVFHGRCNRNIIYYNIFLATFLDLPWSRWRMSSTSTEAVGAIIYTCLILLWLPITSFSMEKCVYRWCYNSQSPSLTQQPRRYYLQVLPKQFGRGLLLPGAVRDQVWELQQRSGDEEKYAKYFSPPPGDRLQSYYSEAGGSRGRRLWVL